MMGKVAKEKKQQSEKQMYWEQFSKRLIALLDKKKMTRSEFAEKMGVTCVSVTHWLNDGRIPSTFYLNKMCDVLKVSADYLIGRKKGEK